MDSAELISRRAILRTGLLGLASVGLAVHPLTQRTIAASTLGTGPTPLATDLLHLTMRECLVEMVDRTPVYSWAFDSPQTGLRLPGPLIEAAVGRPAGIAITNELPRPRSFAIPGVAHTGPIAPGATVELEVEFDRAGTYLYFDPSAAPLARAMGLAGVIAVRPDTDEPTPYSDATPTVRRLFEDLGTTTHFPGHPWVRSRSWVWVFSSVDPASQQRVFEDPDLSPAVFAGDYHPSYFMLNGRSGFFASNDPASALHGRVGQPALVRVANVGMATHSPHVHGNHVYLLAIDGEVQDNVIAHDTWEMPPLRTTDVLLPFARPPDAHPWPPSDPSVWTTDLGGDGHTGMVFPMHCHTELSLLADGGNYPQGLITHWALQGDLVEGPPPEEPDDPQPPDEPGPPDDPDPPDDPPDDPEPPDDPPEGPPGRGRGRPSGPDDPPRPEPPGRGGQTPPGRDRP